MEAEGEGEYDGRKGVNRDEYIGYSYSSSRQIFSVRTVCIVEVRWSRGLCSAEVRFF